MNDVFNYTQIAELGPQEALKQAHSVTAVPAIWELYIFMVLVLVVLGALVAKNSSKYWGIAVLAAILGLIFSLILTLMPNFVQFLASIVS